MTKNGFDPYTGRHEFVSGVLNPVAGDLTASLDSALINHT